MKRTMIRFNISVLGGLDILKEKMSDEEITETMEEIKEAIDQVLSCYVHSSDVVDNLDLGVNDIEYEREKEDTNE